jgi:hypothetical protein
LLDLGRSLVPVGPDKAACGGRWAQWQRKPMPLAELEQRCRDGATALGMVAGATFGLFGVDLDSKEARERWQPSGERAHELTPRGGAHLHVAHPGFYVKSQNWKSCRELGERFPGLVLRVRSSVADREGVGRGLTNVMACRCQRPRSSSTTIPVPSWRIGRRR